MRLLLFFDLPMETATQKRDYRVFRKMIIKEGFLQMQKSVYSKLVLNKQSADLVMNRIQRQLPKEGLIATLIVTEKQFSSIQIIAGEPLKHNEIDNLSRLVIL